MLQCIFSMQGKVYFIIYMYVILAYIELSHLWFDIYYTNWYMLVPKCALSQFANELGSQFANWDLFIPVRKVIAQAQSQFAN